MVKISVEMSNPVYGNTFPKRHGGASANSQNFTSISGGVHHTKNTTSAGAQASTSGIKQKTYAKPERPCVLCNESHRLWHCKLFKRMKPLDRRNVVINHKLCHNCLLASHGTDSCGKKSVCAVSGCGRKHTMYIHCDDEASPEGETQPKAYNGSFYTRDKASYMPIVTGTLLVFIELWLNVTSSFSSLSLRCVTNNGGWFQ